MSMKNRLASHKAVFYYCFATSGALLFFVFLRKSLHAPVPPFLFDLTAQKTKKCIADAMHKKTVRSAPPSQSFHAIQIEV